MNQVQNSSSFRQKGIRRSQAVWQVWEKIQSRAFIRSASSSRATSSFLSFPLSFDADAGHSLIGRSWLWHQGSGLSSGLCFRVQKLYLHLNTPHSSVMHSLTPPVTDSRVLLESVVVRLRTHTMGRCGWESRCWFSTEHFVDDKLFPDQTGSGLAHFKGPLCCFFMF